VWVLCNIMNFICFYVCLQVYFMSKIWHPNISSASGYVCLNILKTDW
jgi:hypothetical protein